MIGRQSGPTLSTDPSPLPVTDRLIVFVPSLLYLAAAGCSALDLWRRRPLARIGAGVLLAAAIVSRIATFLEPGLCPVDVAGGGLGIVSLVLALFVLLGSFAEPRNPAKTVLLLGVIGVFDVLGQIVATHKEAFHPPAKERALGELHGGIILLAYAAFVVGAVYAVLYLILYSVMKRRRLGFWFDRLPSLQQLEARAVSAEQIGLALLSIGLFLGFYSYAVFRGGVPWGDVKFVVAMGLWLWFVVALFLRKARHWHGHRVMWIPVIGLLVMAVVYSVGGGHPFWSGGS